MTVPYPNVLYYELSKAKERLTEYNVETIFMPTNRALPNHVFDIKVNEKKNTLILYVANHPKDSFCLDDRVAYVHNLGRVTGRKSINKNILVSAKAGATDLGIPLMVDDRIIFLYGDTFSGNDCNDGLWNSNFIAYTKNLNFEKGLTFDGVIKDSQGIIKPICQGLHHRDKEENLDLSLHKEVTKIPTGAITIGENVYIFMMHVRHWGKAGEWFVTDNVCYKANKYHLDNFQPTNLVFNCLESERFGQIFPFENEFDKEHIYFVSIPGGRNGDLSLLRVKKEEFENKSSYEICIGENEFVPLKEGLTKDFYILKDHVSEPSIMFNHHLNKWIISCIKPDALYLYQSETLYGPFEDPIKIVTHKEMPSFYGGFVSPCMCKNGDQKLFLQISQWSPIYNTSLLEIVLK